MNIYIVSNYEFMTFHSSILVSLKVVIHGYDRGVHIVFSDCRQNTLLRFCTICTTLIQPQQVAMTVVMN